LSSFNLFKGSFKSFLIGRLLDQSFSLPSEKMLTPEEKEARRLAKAEALAAGGKFLERVAGLAMKINAGEVDIISAIAQVAAPAITHVFKFFDGHALVELELTCKPWHKAIVGSKCWRMILATLLNQEATLARIAVELRKKCRPEQDNLAYKRLYFKVLGAACDLDDNWKSGNFVKRVIPTGEEISQLAVDFTGGIIASSHWLTKGKVNVIRLWDMTTSECKAKISVGPKYPISGLAIQEGFLIACYNLGDELSVWDAATGAVITTHEHAGGLSCFKLKGDIMVTGCRDKTAAVWDVVKQPTRFQLARKLVGHTNLVDCVDCDDEYAVTGSRDQSIRIWNISDGAQVGILTGHMNSLKTIKFCFPWILSGGADRTMRLWDIASSIPLLWKGTLHTAPVFDIDADFRKRIVSLGKAVTIGHQERDEVILWTWQRAGQGTGAVEGSGNPMIYRSKKGIPREVQEGCLAVALSPFHLIAGDVLGNINVLDFLNADKPDEVVEFKDYNPLVGLPVKPKPRDRNDEGYYFSKPVYNHLTKRFMYN